jgi:hypothetical protein
VTCGSGLKWPLNKFFEIPAEGSLLVCYPFSNHEDLGFVDGETCVVMNEPDRINEVLDRIFSDLPEYQRIATKGQQMVMRKHSMTARINQVGEAVSVIMDAGKKFGGAYWKNGEFIIYEK